ncbi:1,2-phenylacetyl-CoA epoxidase subunit PaaD [Rothia sp. CCM 9417]|uniref:1,2-phenylacetyl-CoA epoxidase subunit PaaD n=1 Tax=unclassified Rothia (in: high G+C Gram-positive bacteria) TaxID=2689056 RepID=UPI003AE7BF51
MTNASQAASAGIDFSFGFDQDSGYAAPPREAESAVPAPAGSDATLWELAAKVADPEIPVLSIADLGILRAARYGKDGQPIVVITPTYSGCPAMESITASIRQVFTDHGQQIPQVELVLSPAWSTDWMSQAGKDRLAEYGIAPPSGQAAAGPVTLGLAVKCPRCHSLATKELTRFGSTSCKALYQCTACCEPFDYFKIH